MSEKNKYGAEFIKSNGRWDVLASTYYLTGEHGNTWKMARDTSGDTHINGEYLLKYGAMQALESAPPPPGYVEPKKQATSEEHRYGAKIDQSSNGEWCVFTDTHYLSPVNNDFWVAHGSPLGKRYPLGLFPTKDAAMDRLNEAPTPPTTAKDQVMSEENKYGAEIVKAVDGLWDVLTDTHFLRWTRWVKWHVPAGTICLCGEYLTEDDARKALEKVAPPPPDSVEPKDQVMNENEQLKRELDSLRSSLYAACVGSGCINAYELRESLDKARSNLRSAAVDIAEMDKMRIERRTAIMEMDYLLDRIHQDNGYYMREHGREKAIMEAHETVADLVRENATLAPIQSRNCELVAEVVAWRNEYLSWLNRDVSNWVMESQRSALNDAAVQEYESYHSE